MIQEREFQRVGSNKSIKADVRIIAATNVNLEEAVKERRFRNKPMTYHDGVNASKRKLVEDALRKAGGNYIEAAAILDLHPTHLYRLTRDLFPKSSSRSLR